MTTCLRDLARLALGALAVLAVVGVVMTMLYFGAKWGAV